MAAPKIARGKRSRRYVRRLGECGGHFGPPQMKSFKELNASPQKRQGAHR